MAPQHEPPSIFTFDYIGGDFKRSLRRYECLLDE